LTKLTNIFLSYGIDQTHTL